MKPMELSDLSTIVGVLMLGAAIFWAYGTPGVIGYAGGVLIVLGVMLAIKERTSKPESGG